VAGCAFALNVYSLALAAKRWSRGLNGILAFNVDLA
jgi:hypothetical protein